MIPPSQIVSIHPYFKVQPGRMAEAKTILQRFVASTTAEKGNLYYDFTIHENTVFCREAYIGADGLITHLGNIGPILDDFLKLAEVVRLEVHGSAPELEKLRGPLGAMNPEWYVFECGVTR